MMTYRWRECIDKTHREKERTRRMMNHQFKTDASNATLNPLYIQKNVTIESPPTPPPATTKLSYY